MGGLPFRIYNWSPGIVGRVGYVAGVVWESVSGAVHWHKSFLAWSRPSPFEGHSMMVKDMVIEHTST